MGLKEAILKPDCSKSIIYISRAVTKSTSWATQKAKLQANFPVVLISQDFCLFVLDSNRKVDRFSIPVNYFYMACLRSTSGEAV